MPICAQSLVFVVACMGLGCAPDAAAPSLETTDAEDGEEAQEVDATEDGSDAVDAASDACKTDCEASITWAPCPLYYDHRDGPMAECATVEVPLRWDDPAGPTIGVFVQRLRGGGQVRGQLWLLNGGPGGSGADFDDWMEAFRMLDPTLDVYTVDHRGTGRSARLSCPDQESEASESGFYLTAQETAACYEAERAEWGEGLARFTTTAAARDVGQLIARAAVPGQDVFVYGVSYGTYWAHRYLQLFPNQADAVVLDSIAPPTQDFTIYDRTFDAVGQDFLRLCGADAICGAKLGADPWRAVKALFTSVKRGHCPELVADWGLDATSLRTVLGTLLTGVETRTYLPAVVYRMARCEPGDVEAVGNLLQLFFGGDEGPSYYDTLGSDSLFYNVTLSELWPEEPPTAAEIDAEQATLYVSTGLTSEIAAATWGKYADDAWVGRWAETDTPLLMMNGDLDPQTPLAVAREMASHFTGPHQQFVTVPRAAHAVTVRTPVAPGATPCGMQLFLAFLAAPEAPLDLRCLDEIPAESFVGDPALNRIVFGMDDLWENEP